MPRYLLTLIVILISSCKNDNLEDIHPGIFDPPEIPCPDTLGMTYLVNIKPIFETKCGSTLIDCHKSGNTQDINLDNYFDAKDLAVNGDLLGGILHLSGFEPMPKNAGFLDQCNINKIKNWINNGEPE
jgi:hypothetical protein